MWKRLSSLFRRSQLDRELTEEIETHLAMHEEIFRRQGMTPEAARLAARREFGGVAQTMEAYRDRRGIRWLETCLADLRYALRGLRLSPGFAAAAIGTLALGIAVNTTIFSVVDAVLLRPLPYRNADRLELLWTTYPKQNAFELPTGYPNIQDWRQARSFEAMAWFRDEPVVLKEGPEPEQVDAAFVSPDFFGMLGVQPALGRFFTAAESERGEHLLVLDYGLWQRRFGGSRAVLGRVLRIESLDATVIGVLPASFRPLRQATQLWMPHTSATFFDYLRTERSTKFGWNVLARLRRGVSPAQAQAEMDGIAARLAAAWPKSNSDSGVRVISLLDQVTGHVRLALSLLLAAVALVLLIACANLGNLLLARAAGREREMAVRASLGATRARLIGQLLTESALLSLIAATLGFALAALGLRALLTIAPASVPRLNEVSLNLRALLFTVAISLLSALFFGLAPALRLAGRAMPAQRGVGGTRSTRRFRNVLVVAEYALAIVLLAGAGLVVRSLASVLRVDPGFHAAGVLTVELHSPGQNDPLNPPRFHGLVEALEALPGVEAAGGISRYFQANVMQNGVTIPGATSAGSFAFGSGQLRRDRRGLSPGLGHTPAPWAVFLTQRRPGCHQSGDRQRCIRPRLSTRPGPGRRIVSPHRRSDRLYDCRSCRRYAPAGYHHPTDSRSALASRAASMGHESGDPDHRRPSVARERSTKHDPSIRPERGDRRRDDHGSTDGRTDCPAPLPDPPSRYLRGHGAGSRHDRYLRIDALFRHGA